VPKKIVIEREEPKDEPAEAADEEDEEEKARRARLAERMAKARQMNARWIVLIVV
jgi:hypothetical protein